MIGFVLSNGEQITARTNQQLEFELNNAALENSLLEGSHSLEITIDDVNGNLRKLQLANRHDLLERNTVFNDVQLQLFGLKQYTGKLVIRRVRSTSVDAFLVLNGISIAILNMMLSEVNYGNSVNLGSTPSAIATAASGYVTQNWPDVDFNFPTIYAPNLYKNESVGWKSEDNVEPWDDESTYRIRDAVLFTDGKIYSCIDATSAAESPLTHPTKWAELESNCLINNWDDGAGSFRINESTYIRTQNAHALAPQMYDKFVLKRIEQTIGYRIVGDFISDALTDQSLLLNTKVLDATPPYVVVKVEQDAVYDANTNPYVTAGTYITGTGGGYYIHFNNVITDPDSDWTIVNPYPAYPAEPSYYTIHSEGIHRVTVVLELLSGASDPPYDLKLQINGIDVDIYQFSTASGTITHTFELFVPAGNIGHKMTLQIINSMGIGVFEFDAGTYVQIENLSANQYNAWSGVVEHANHVPDVTVGKYLLSLKTRFNLTANLNFFDREIRLNYAKNILDREAADYTDLLDDIEADVQQPQGATLSESPLCDVPFSDGSDHEIAATYANYQDMVDATADHELDDVVLLTNQFAFWRLESDDNGLLKWVFQSSSLPPLVYGNGARQLTMIDQPAQLKYINVDGDMMLVPWFNLNGNTVLFGGINHQKPIVHAIWKGMQDAENGTYQYPMATPAVYDASGAGLGNMDLRFLTDVPQSIWKLFYADWIRKVDHSLVFEATANLNYKQIFQVDFDSPIRIRFIKYVLRRVIWGVDQSGTIKAEVQAVKIMP